MLTKFDAESAAARPVAYAALAKMSGIDVTPQGAEDLSRIFIGEMTKEIGKIKPADCGTANRFVELLSPLPVENIVGLFWLFLEIGTKEGAPLDLPICPA